MTVRLVTPIPEDLKESLIDRATQVGVPLTEFVTSILRAAVQGDYDRLFSSTRTVYHVVLGFATEYDSITARYSRPEAEIDLIVMARAIAQTKVYGALHFQEVQFLGDGSWRLRLRDSGDCLFLRIQEKQEAIHAPV